VIEARLIEWCRIQTGEQTTGTADDRGHFTTQKTYTSSRCLFSNGKGGTLILESGEHVQRAPSVLLPASTAITEGQVLEGLVLGFLHTYRVLAAKLIKGRTPSHVRADLEAIQ